MDVSFSAWRHSREESLQLKGDSFSFLFDRRYTNRLNRMSRVFFEAYVAATKELAAQEDRFPSLSEIDAKMESGAVYAFKDRLMKNTEFFEEVKISGVSYLVPRALKFMDVTGTYTDLSLNLEEGTVLLPTRRKTPLPVDSSPRALEDGEREDEATGTVSGDAGQRDSEPVVRAAKAGDSRPERADAPPPVAVEVSGPGSLAQPALPQQNASYPPHAAEPFAEIAGPVQEVPPSPLQETARRAEPERPAAPAENRAAASVPGMPAKDTASSPAGRILGIQPRIIALLGFALLLAVVIAIGLLGNQPAPLAVPPVFVEYSAYLSNASNDSYLAMEIVNSEKMANDMEMTLPADIDRSISARGGVVTISHGENTVVRMNSSSDASIKIYLNGNWTVVPIGLTFATPAGYDTSLQVHDEDYLVTRRNETLALRLNLTGQEVRFEQSYTRKG